MLGFQAVILHISLLVIGDCVSYRTCKVRPMYGGGRAEVRCYLGVA